MDLLYIIQYRNPSVDPMSTDLADYESHYVCLNPIIYGCFILNFFYQACEM